LVSAQFVVTAAHCVFGSTATQVDVLTNTQTLDGSGVRHEVDSIRYHPRYNDRTTDFDIAVIKLKTVTTNISMFARMLAKTEEINLTLPGETAFVTGWGNLSGNGSNYPTTLRQVEVPLVSRNDCNDANSYDGAITLRMICAGESDGGKDACDGDSGGPLIVRDEQDQWRVLAGVVSWGIGCAEPDLFGVYSRMAVLSNWARKTIRTMGGPSL
jgi:secreted trypsin-like serine protease